MNTREHKIMIKLGFLFFSFSFFSFQNCPFWAYVKNIITFTFLVHGHSSRSTFGLHLVRGPKVL